MSPKALRRLILSASRRADVGHIGCCLCVVEIVAVLYGEVLRALDPDDPDRDRVVLSKGHAALALYSAFLLRGWLTSVEFEAFCQAGSLLGVHPVRAVRGVDFATGSLGQGVTMAVGAALAARLQHSSRHVYCLMSDAECNEGSTWEAAMFAAHHRLDALTAVIDVNGQQALGRTSDVLDLDHLAARWHAFGWAVTEVDGHSRPALRDALLARHGRPHVILAKTTFGRGVSFMERGEARDRGLPPRPHNWHYLSMSAREFEIASRELEAAPEDGVL